MEILHPPVVEVGNDGVLRPRDELRRDARHGLRLTLRVQLAAEDAEDRRVDHRGFGRRVLGPAPGAGDEPDDLRGDALLDQVPARAGHHPLGVLDRHRRQLEAMIEHVRQPRPQPQQLGKEFLPERDQHAARIPAGIERERRGGILLQPRANAGGHAPADQIDDLVQEMVGRLRLRLGRAAVGEHLLELIEHEHGPDAAAALVEELHVGPEEPFPERDAAIQRRRVHLPLLRDRLDRVADLRPQRRHVDQPCPGQRETDVHRQAVRVTQQREDARTKQRCLAEPRTPVQHHQPVLSDQPGEVILGALASEEERVVGLAERFRSGPWIIVIEGARGSRRAGRGLCRHRVSPGSSCTVP